MCMCMYIITICIISNKINNTFKWGETNKINNSFKWGETGLKFTLFITSAITVPVSGHSLM